MFVNTVSNMKYGCKLGFVGFRKGPASSSEGSNHGRRCSQQDHELHDQRGLVELYPLKTSECCRGWMSLAHLASQMRN